MENQRTECSSAEIKFSRGREDFLHVELRGNGEAVVYVGGDDPGPCSEYTLTLGQAIQLRDFLNRHIDELALKQTGSLAVRSSDDPKQLAAVEEVSATRDNTPEAQQPLLRAIRDFAREGSAICSAIDAALVSFGHSQKDNTHACAHPHRWLQSARMDLQTGIMKLERAVKNPAAW